MCKVPSALNVELQTPASPSAQNSLSTLDSSNWRILLELGSSTVSACSSHGHPWQLEMLSRCSVFCSAVLGAFPVLQGLSVSRCPAQLLMPLLGYP